MKIDPRLRQDINTLVKSPIGIKGKWMSLNEIKKLGNSWSDLELMDILEWGISPYPVRERRVYDKGDDREYFVKEYFIDHKTIGSFAQNSKYMDIWKGAYEDLSRYLASA